MGLLFALVLVLAVFLVVVNTRAGRALELVSAQQRELARLRALVDLTRAREWAEPAAEPEPEPVPEPVARPWPPVPMSSQVGVRAAPRPRRHGPGPISRALRQGWDQWIAANLLAVAGGVFVLLGAAFFVAVAISHG